MQRTQPMDDSAEFHPTASPNTTFQSPVSGLCSRYPVKTVRPPSPLPTPSASSSVFTSTSPISSPRKESQCLGSFRKRSLFPVLIVCLLCVTLFSFMPFVTITTNVSTTEGNGGGLSTLAKVEFHTHRTSHPPPPSKLALALQNDKDLDDESLLLDSPHDASSPVNIGARVAVKRGSSAPQQIEDATSQFEIQSRRIRPTPRPAALAATSPPAATMSSERRKMHNMKLAQRNRRNGYVGADGSRRVAGGDWGAPAGLGSGGVTSNHRHALAPSHRSHIPPQTGRPVAAGPVAPVFDEADAHDNNQFTTKLSDRLPRWFTAPKTSRAKSKTTAARHTAPTTSSADQLSAELTIEIFKRKTSVATLLSSEGRAGVSGSVPAGLSNVQCVGEKMASTTLPLFNLCSAPVVSLSSSTPQPQSSARMSPPSPPVLLAAMQRKDRKEMASHFKHNGYWHDCLTLPWLAHWAHDHSTMRTVDNLPTVVEVSSVESNIGACSLLLASESCHVTAITTPTDPESLTDDADTTTTEPSDASETPLSHPIVRSALVNNYQKRLTVINDQRTATRLSSAVHNHVHLLVIDVDGFEPQVLQGAKALIKSHGVDVIRVKFNPELLYLRSKPTSQEKRKTEEKEETSSSILDIFNILIDELGYGVYIQEEGKLLSLEDVERRFTTNLFDDGKDHHDDPAPAKQKKEYTHTRRSSPAAFSSSSTSGIDSEFSGTENEKTILAFSPHLTDKVIANNWEFDPTSAGSAAPLFKSGSRHTNNKNEKLPWESWRRLTNGFFPAMGPHLEAHFSEELTRHDRQKKRFKT